MKSMLFGAESAVAANPANQNQDQQSDIVLAQLSQVGHKNNKNRETRNIIALFFFT